jgi:ubiquinone/menaquinone biosynthesis C-methylase UbiE
VARSGEVVVVDPKIRFSDGASYDAMMGGWSRSVGAIFLDWLRPAKDLDWVDVGCGSGAFTSLVVERWAPRSILGVDPSEAQLEFARTKDLKAAQFARGDAMNLELADRSVDVAVAALVMHFMPDPAKGVAEMSRVVRPGGLVAAFAWDLAGGGFPYEAVHSAMRDFGLAVPQPPHPEAADADELARLWRGAGLVNIEQREVVVSRAFTGVDEYWETATKAPRIAAVLADVPPEMSLRLKEAAATTLARGLDGFVTPIARANAIVGTVPVRTESPTQRPR